MSGGFAQFQEFSQAQSFGLSANSTGFVNGMRLVAASATINTKGSWVSLGTLNSDCMALILGVNYLNNSGTDTGVSVDIGIGASSGVVEVLINDINQSQSGAFTYLNIFQHLLPIALPSGTQIWARSAANVASTTATIGAAFVAIDNSFSTAREFSGVDTLGKTATGAGTVLVGAAGAKGSYVQIGTATHDYGGFFLCFDFAGQASVVINCVVDIAIGPSGSQIVVLPNLRMSIAGQFSATDFEYLPIPIPNGSAIWGRASNTDGSTQSIGVTFYGVFQ